MYGSFHPFRSDVGIGTGVRSFAALYAVKTRDFARTASPRIIRITAATNNVNLFTLAGSPTAPVWIRCIVDADVGSTSTGTYAFDCGSGWHSRSIVEIEFTWRCRLSGAGGAGGAGGGCNAPTPFSGSGGNVGGPAFNTGSLTRGQLFIWNYAVAIQSGGGGGAGGGGAYNAGASSDGKSCIIPVPLSAGGGGGGGGAGINPGGGAGGGTATGGSVNSSGNTGGTGTATAGGSAVAGGVASGGDCAPATATGGTSGAGGAPASSGGNSNAGTGSSSGSGASGAGPGNAINGDSKIAWMNLGVVNGARVG